jgi:prevent-host-death family protein
MIEITNMNLLSANDAKTQFGDLLLKVQRAPVQINKNGKPVAVVISMDEYEGMETLKMQMLQSRAAQAASDIQMDNTAEGESFFDDMEKGHYD